MKGRKEGKNAKNGWGIANRKATGQERGELPCNPLKQGTLHKNPYETYGHKKSQPENRPAPINPTAIVKHFFVFSIVFQDIFS